MIFLNLVLAELRLGLKKYQVGETRILDDYLYLCKGLLYHFKNKMNDYGAYNCPSISRKNPRATY
ncbi:hypothetical protein THERMOT_1206 [Bathymodiolus thermophilus thioautotrophic gill symbiont]|nr:hypothetical protein THERMOT_1206 [Bathymodiolus thermophilus thioautotrophic gill symbiont]